MQNPSDSTTGMAQQGMAGQGVGGNAGMGGQDVGTTGNAGATGMGGGNVNAGGGGGDMLDKGVDYAERRAGHEQSHSTTEKISDGIRKGVNKLTGKNVPVQDKNYQ